MHSLKPQQNDLFGENEQRVWQQIRTNYWFVPGVLSVLAANASVLMERLDYALADKLPDAAWVRSVRGSGEGDFVPALSVALAVALALTSVGVLIYFAGHQRPLHGDRVPRSPGICPVPAQRTGAPCRVTP